MNAWGVADVSLKAKRLLILLSKRRNVWDILIQTQLLNGNYDTSLGSFNGQPRLTHGIGENDTQNSIFKNFSVQNSIIIKL